MICPVTYLAWCEARKVMTSVDLAGLGHVPQRSCRGILRDRGGDPAGIGDRGVEHVRGNGETTGSAGREADDAARGG
ncbi:hypothetical protein, partial [Frankia sp. Cr1]|uniref:hypothetical protein n=1 Tax=Frankia sp. Cr1 TaxID=3073931 RepID=UPI002AD2CEDD